MNPRLIAIAVVSAAVGAAVGYKVAERKLIVEFEERLDRETNALRRMHKTDYETPDEMVEALHGEAVKAMQDYASKDVAETEELFKKEPVAYHKIKTSSVPVGDKEPEDMTVRNRVFEVNEDQGPIFIISAEDNAGGVYDTETLTWYQQDGVLTYADDSIFEDYERHIGGDDVRPLENFGGISGDENVVYVRSEVAMMDFEIIRNPGSYSKEILDVEYQPPVQRPSQRMHGS